MKRLKYCLCTALALALTLLCAFGAAADTTVGVTGAGTFKMEQTYVNVPELDVYFYALDGNGNPYSPVKVQAAGPELTLVSPWPATPSAISSRWTTASSLRPQTFTRCWAVCASWWRR